MQRWGKPNRRVFLERSAAAGAAIAAIGPARAAHAAGSDQLRVVLIGAGGRGTGATADCLNVARNAKLVAIADAFADRAQSSLKLLRQYFGDRVAVPRDRLFVGLEAYQQALACPSDLVITAAPPGFRPIHYRAAVEAGKHVFLEKPLCIDAPGFRSVMETNKLAQQKGLKIGVGLYRRHHPAYQKGIRRIQEGQIGQIQFMRCTCNMTAWGGMQRKPGMSEMETQIRFWRCFDWLSGGRLVEAHCHELDVMDWAMGDHPVEANGMGGRQVCTSGRFAADYDHHFHEYLYANGVRMYSQSRAQDNVWQDITEHVHGTKGVLDFSGKILKINEYPGREATSPYRLEHADLLDAIRNDKPYHEGWIGATSSFTAILGREASYSGQIVKWDELVARGRRIFPEKISLDGDPPMMPNAEGNYNHLVAMPGIYTPWEV